MLNTHWQLCKYGPHLYLLCKSGFSLFAHNVIYLLKGKRSRLSQGHLKVKFRSRSLEGQLKFKVIWKANSKVTRKSAKGQGQISRSRSPEGQLKVNVIWMSNSKVKVTWRSVQGRRSRSSKGQSLRSGSFQCQRSRLKVTQDQVHFKVTGQLFSRAQVNVKVKL